MVGCSGVEKPAGFPPLPFPAFGLRLNGANPGMGRCGPATHGGGRDGHTVTSPCPRQAASQVWLRLSGRVHALHIASPGRVEESWRATVSRDNTKLRGPLA